MGKDKDEKKTIDPEGGASSYVDPDARRNIATDNRSSTRTRSQHNTRSTSLDFARLAEAIGTAHDKGASSAHKQVDVLHDALKEAHATIKSKDALIDDKNEQIGKLIGKLALLAENNISLQMLESRTRVEETATREKYASIRAAITAFGPAAGPLMQRVVPMLLPAMGDLADKGDKSPRSCAIRVFSKLQDGSDISARIVGIIADFAEDDWPGTLMFLAEMANSPAPTANAHH